MDALSVSAAVFTLRDVLEASEFFGDLWIEGEVATLTTSQRGHRYLTLKDDEASLRTVLFANTQPGLQFKQGDSVLVHGRISVYPQRGELQFVADFLRPAGVGIAGARFARTKEALEAEGLFAPERKRPLPAMPATIGVVTSTAGAALQDVLHAIERRWPLATVIISPAQVQGEEAPFAIREALETLGELPEIDVTLVVRGGGSAEDLQAFNEEVVARAVFRHPHPVVSGVGHETDTTIIDLVADHRAPTPTAAAELATPNRYEVLRALSGRGAQMTAAIRARLREESARADRQVRALERAAPQVGARREAAERALGEMGVQVLQRLRDRQARRDTIGARLQALDPRATLDRGYASVELTEGGMPVVSWLQAPKGAGITVNVSDGSFKAKAV